MLPLFHNRLDLDLEPHRVQTKGLAQLQDDGALTTRLDTVLTKLPALKAELERADDLDKQRRWNREVVRKMAEQRKRLEWEQKRLDEMKMQEAKPTAQEVTSDTRCCLHVAGSDASIGQDEDWRAAQKAQEQEDDKKKKAEKDEAAKEVRRAIKRKAPCCKLC
jgi:hypothetical protein